MHAIELTELAALFATYSPDLLKATCVPDRQAQQEYWLESKYRHEGWSNRIAEHRRGLQELGVARRGDCWRQILPVIEDILLSEPLTRCIAYHARLLVDLRIDRDLSAVALNVLTSHLEARNRCLHLIVFGEGLAIEQGARLNHLRQQLENYTDGLLGQLPSVSHDEKLCFDLWRVRQQQISAPATNGPGNLRKFVLSAQAITLRLALARNLGPAPPSLHINRRLHAAVLRMLPAELFDSLGLPRTSQHHRLLVESSESSKLDQFFTQSPTLTACGLAAEATRATGRSAAERDRRW